MAINETLKFSWGHIIAFVAIIFISYVSFMGISYLTDGDFLWAGIGVVLIDVLLVLFFIGAQLLKGTEEKFKKRVILERILVFTSPFIFCVVMIPYAHFWTVFERRGTIENTFSTSLRSTKQMFVSYNEYSDARIKVYDSALSKGRVSQTSRANKIQALKLQLVSDNFVSLKNEANQWIDRASSATVWNVFMIGNIHLVQNALTAWNSSLTLLSSKIMSDEPKGTKSFTDEDISVVTASTNLDTLTAQYRKMGAPTWIAICTALILLFMLYFPYVIQNRNTKSKKRLIGSEESSVSLRNKNKKQSKSGEINTGITSDDDDDILSFKM